jgi:hypothetical protein
MGMGFIDMAVKGPMASVWASAASIQIPCLMFFAPASNLILVTISVKNRQNLSNHKCGREIIFIPLAVIVLRKRNRGIRACRKKMFSTRNLSSTIPIKS